MKVFVKRPRYQLPLDTKTLPEMPYMEAAGKHRARNHSSSPQLPSTGFKSTRSQALCSLHQPTGTNFPPASEPTS